MEEDDIKYQGMEATEDVEGEAVKDREAVIEKEEKIL